MTDEKFMNLNKETALRLWTKQFGKRQKALDFAGREIAKAAYNDRNSNYGWNVDHIFPLSRGGKTADYNLICCHILSNDEKADRFPCFKANEKVFEIQRRQNHYEIVERTTLDEGGNEDEIINFLDAAQGLRCWKSCKPGRGQTFVGYVKIKVKIPNDSDQLLERYGKFLFELFDTENIFVESAVRYNNYRYSLQSIQDYVFTVISGIVPTKEDTQNFLDDCVMLLNCKKDIVEKQIQFTDSLAVDELVKINTSAEKELKGILRQGELYPYKFIFTKLGKDLGKYV